MKLQCNFCRHKTKTDKLYLITVCGRDYLLCQSHKEKHEVVADKNKSDRKE